MALGYTHFVHITPDVQLLTPTAVNSLEKLQWQHNNVKCNNRCVLSCFLVCEANVLEDLKYMKLSLYKKPE